MTPLATNKADATVTATDHAAHHNALAVAVNLLNGAALNIQHPDYGAVGDNSNDDTAEIQAAIDACSAAGGGMVFFPEGIYRVSSALSVPNFVSLAGTGQSTVLRCTGNHYAINLNPANRVAIHNLMIDAVSSQSSGGGIDFTNAANNVWISDLYFGNYLHTSLNIQHAVQGGHIIIERVRWNGVLGCTFGIIVGTGSVIVSDVYVSHLVATASTATDMSCWIKLRKGGADTFHLTDSLFYQGAKGMEIGVEGAAGDSTNHKFTSVVWDNMDTQGVDIDKCRGVDFSNCAIQGCGTSTLAGLDIGAEAQAVSWNGGFIHECEMDGVLVRAGALETMIGGGAKILNNNRTNQTFGAGVEVAANASSWSVIGCTLGNDLGVVADQRYGLLVAGGSSTDYVVANNRCVGNDVAPYLFGTQTGVRGRLTDNFPEVISSVVAAATITLPPGDVVTVTGNTNITSLAATFAGDRVTLTFTGTPTFTDGSNLKLAGNLVATADDTISLFCDGTNWFETGRSAN